MKKSLLFIILSCLAVFFNSCNRQEINTRQRTSFNNNWKFSLGDVEGASVFTFDDNDWRQLNLPHDWAIEGEFSKDNPSGTGGGALPGGIGWYRKTFVADETYVGKKVFIDFDGVYMNSEVFINGVSLGKRPYGYISFRYDLTPYLKIGEENVIAVKVDNQEQPNSRWYSGCGIYRNVWLTVTNPIHVDLWGTYVTTPQVSDKEATVSVCTSIKNEGAVDAEVKVVSSLLDAEGNLVGETTSVLPISKDSVGTYQQTMKVDSPILWSVNNPYLYTLETEVWADGKLVDTYETTTGIRSFEFSAEKGFVLNGEQVKIKGVCMHHDLGCLGAAVNTRAIERQLEILQEMGCNGIRCSHNPPAPELLQLCDEMGFIVMDETFDMWRKKKTRYDYSLYFNEWHERDLTDLMLRDRNHPSIFMWSIGNEVLEQWSDANADTLSLEEANMILNFGHSAEMLAKEGSEMSVNSLLTKKLADMTRALDPTRPVTAGCNEPNPYNHLFASGALDIIGFNYHDDWFMGVPKNFPGKPFIVTESVSSLMTRGYYKMPSDKPILCPERWDKPYYDPSFSCSSYDHCRAPWGSHHENTLRLVSENDFISGQYIWTGFDYIGEPTPYGWPARSSYFGIVDLAGFPKDIYYMYQSQWTDKDVLHLFPHWNWEEGQEIDLWAYFNHADEVELFVNGRSQGVRTMPDDKYHVVWRVKYEPGTIKAVSRKDGKVVMEKEIHTAGEPAQIRLSADRSEIQADGTDLSFITVEIVDKDGNLCPNANNLVNFDVQGAAFIAGVDNGNQTSMESFKAPHRKAFYGKCLVVLQNNGERGNIQLNAVSEGLEKAMLNIQAN
ncbi:MAG: DUF4982 domain-containing protein [Bacteroides sp.]|nr:DUF4982 domain-containing protein [Bacteroides sp.]